MRNKTQHEKADSSVSDARNSDPRSSDAREERSRKADVGEAAEQSTQGSPTGKKGGRQGSAPGRVTK